MFKWTNIYGAQLNSPQLLNPKPDPCKEIIFSTEISYMNGRECSIPGLKVAEQLHKSLSICTPIRHQCKDVRRLLIIKELLRHA